MSLPSSRNDGKLEICRQCPDFRYGDHLWRPPEAIARSQRVNLDWRVARTFANAHDFRQTAMLQLRDSPVAV